MIAAILFDKDGTLLDYDQTWAPIQEEAARRVAGSDQDHVRRLLLEVGYDTQTRTTQPNSILSAGSPRDIAAAWHPLLPHHDEESLEALIAEVFKDARFPQIAFPDTVEVVEALVARNMSLGVATHDTSAGAIRFLQAHGIDRHFCFVSGYDGEFPHKPDPKVLHYFADISGVTASECCVVGDSEGDIALGRNGGAGLVIAIDATGELPDGIKRQADHVISRLSELIAILDRKNAGA